MSMTERVARAYGVLRGVGMERYPAQYYGLDLGKTNDYSALTVLRAATHSGGIPILRSERTFTIGHLRRFPLRTKYVDIVESVGKLIRADRGKMSDVFLVVERNAVGEGVLEMFELAGLEPWGIFSTPGNQVTKGEGVRQWNVPKRDLVSAADVAMQTGRLKIGPGLKFTKELRDELANFTVKFTALGHDSYEAQKSGEHDDIVMSVALAVWAARTAYVDADGPVWGPNPTQFRR